MLPSPMGASPLGSSPLAGPMPMTLQPVTTNGLPPIGGGNVRPGAHLNQLNSGLRQIPCVAPWNDQPHNGGSASFSSPGGHTATDACGGGTNVGQQGLTLLGGTTGKL